MAEFLVILKYTAHQYQRSVFWKTPYSFGFINSVGTNHSPGFRKGGEVFLKIKRVL